MFARAMVLAALLSMPLSGMTLSLLATGCGSNTSKPAGTPEKKSTAAHREHAPDKDAVSEKGKKWGGWRWKGDREDCFYVVGNKCFAKERNACAAAKCGKSACLVKPGAPAKVSCPKNK